VPTVLGHYSSSASVRTQFAYVFLNKIFQQVGLHCWYCLFFPYLCLFYHVFIFTSNFASSGRSWSVLCSMLQVFYLLWFTPSWSQWIWFLITLQSMAGLAEIDKSMPFEVYLNYTIINVYHDEQLCMISILFLILRVLWDSFNLVPCCFLLSPLYLWRDCPETSFLWNLTTLLQD